MASKGTFQAPQLAKWFHSSLHKDFEFDDTTTIFTPSDRSYKEALALLAMIVASFGGLLFILLLFYYTCCHFICKREAGILPCDVYQRRRSCCQSCIFIFALICCGALVVGFIFNGKASDGVDQFCSCVDDITDDINDASKMGRNAKIPLDHATAYIRDLKTVSGLIPEAQSAWDLCDNISGAIDVLNNQYLPVGMVNRGSDVGGKIHRYDNYRWLVTVGLLTWCVFLCVFCYWSYCQTNGCIMFVLTILSFSLVPLSWAVLGAHFGIATGVGDFCVHPAKSIKHISDSNITSAVIDYYIKCSNHNPFYGTLETIDNSLNTVFSLIKNIQQMYGQFKELTNKILQDLYVFKSDISLYQSEFGCAKIHKKYMNAMDGLCDNGLTGLAVVILAFLSIGLVSGLLTCCICPLWKYRRPYHHAHPNSGNARGDGNAVLWWPDGLDSDPDENHAHGQGNPGASERDPLITDLRSPNYETVNHSNLNYIQPNINFYMPMDGNAGHSKRDDDSQHSARHSF